MFKIQFINNIVFKDGLLYALDRTDNLTRVFIRQGNLEGRCTIYSLMMMLMFHKRISREDLLYRVDRNAPSYIKRLKKQLLSSKRRARSLEEMREKLLSSFENQISVEVYTLPKYKDYCANAKCLHNKIKSHLDLGLPVQISYFFPNEMLGHSVVVIGYSFCESVIHLYCLDPSIRMVHTTIWNNVIDLNLNYNDSNRMDYDHMAEKKIFVKGILLIEDTCISTESIEETPFLPFESKAKDTELPFEPEAKDTILPF